MPASDVNLIEEHLRVLNKVTEEMKIGGRVMKMRFGRVAVTMMITAVMFLATQLSAFAAAPAVEEVEYKGKGRVEVEFHGKVQYKNVKVTVKDTAGKTYNVSAIRKDSDDISFNINKFQTGKTYKISVKGVKVRGSKSFGTVSGKVTIPKAVTGKAITAKKAIEIAKADAAKKWNVKKTWDVDVEKDKFKGQQVWEVSFNGTINGRVYEFEYEITRNGGKVLRGVRELDD